MGYNSSFGRNDLPLGSPYRMAQAARGIPNLKQVPFPLQLPETNQTCGEYYANCGHSRCRKIRAVRAHDQAIALFAKEHPEILAKIIKEVG